MIMAVHLVFYFATNLAALFALDYLVTGFSISTDLTSLLAAAAVFTLLNTYIRPLVRYFFTTFIIISLGLFSLVINAGLLLLLDFLSESVTITGLIPLLRSTLVVAAANILIGLFNRFLFKKNV